MIKHQRKSSRFIIGKSSCNTLHGRSKLNYRKNIEKALIASILIALFVFRLAANLDVKKYFVKEENLVFEFIDIPDIPPVVPEKPKLKMEKVVELPVEEEKSEQEKIAEEVAELLGENENEAQLTLSSENMGNYLLSNSPLSSIGNKDFSTRSNLSYDGGNISLRGGKSYLDEETDGLNIGKAEQSKRVFVSDNADLDIKTPTENPGEPNGKERYQNNEPKLGISGLPERILSFGSATMGTEDYKLWNKIEAELDRLNKGRYGMVPKELHRTRSGFKISFKYPDGDQHIINCRNDGNVWIKVIGHNNHSNIYELRRALNGLLALSLGN